MIQEQPPILKGDAEHQVMQLRDYLIRLVKYINESEQQREQK